MKVPPAPITSKVIPKVHLSMLALHETSSSAVRLIQPPDRIALGSYHRLDFSTIHLSPCIQLCNANNTHAKYHDKPGNAKDSKFIWVNLS